MRQTIYRSCGKSYRLVIIRIDRYLPPTVDYAGDGSHRPEFELQALAQAMETRMNAFHLTIVIIAIGIMIVACLGGICSAMLGKRDSNSSD